MRKHCKSLLIVSLGVLAVCGGCDGNSQHRENGSAAATKGKPTQVPLPVVPHEYDRPDKRIKYVLSVNWDNLDFTDRSLSLDTAFMEQSFSNFIFYFQYEQNALPAMTNLVENAAADTLATIFVWEIADKYLNDPNSPMRNGEIYRTFLHALAKTPVLTDVYRDKLAYQTKVAELNRPGAMANDFRFETRSGKRTSLRSAAMDNVTMLVFYDPDCESCKGIMKKLSEATLPEGLRVIAIDAEDDRDLWKLTADRLPESWTVGFATDDVHGKLMYYLPAMPTIYLLDKGGKVLLKDSSTETAISTAISILGRRNK